MIVPMKKVTILCIESCQDATLEHLRRLGLMHIDPVRASEGEFIDKARKDLEYVRCALEILPHRPHVTPSGHTAPQIVSALWKLIHERRECEEELQDLRHEEARIAPLGSFDLAGIHDLARNGLMVRIFQIDSHRELPQLPGVVVQELSRDKTARIFALLAKEVPPVDGQEIRLPEKSLREVRTRIAELENLLEKNQAYAAAFGGDYPAVAALAGEAEEQVRFLEIRTGMGTAGRVVYLRGYCPQREVPRIRKAARQDGWGLFIETPGETDSVPTLMDNPAWVRPIRTVFDMIGVSPGYNEVDVSAVFLIFLSLFFAMLVGDAGYGAIFLGLTLWVRRTKPGVPPHAIHFLLLMSGSTILWGVLTGTLFGMARLPAVLQSFKVDWLDNTSHVMGLCFLIGSVHLTLAHVWNFWRNRRTLQALAQIGWIAITWAMYFTASAMVLNRVFPKAGYGLFGGGIVLVILFMTPPAKFKEEWFNHAMLPLNLVSSFVDVVSYIRLFAVGTASLAVAQAFNQMAIGDGINGFLHGVLAALVLFLGHALNIILSVMGVIVHGVRLNTLEFSGHLGMQWTGIPYRPFSRILPPETADVSVPIPVKQ